ncbi:MAG: T9SS type A sorting domain-containing protein, partial [Bacteroidota bacterium]
AIDDIQITGILTNRNLANITIGPGTNSCYNAGQTITVAGSGTTFLVQSGGDATLIAGQNILFMPGTMVQSGGHLSGYITTTSSFCVNPSSPVSNPLNPETAAITAETEPGSTLFRVYPNPTTGKFTLELNAPTGETNANVTIYGMLGEKVLQEKLEGTGKSDFSLTGRSGGIYIIQVTMGERTATAKIIKQ